jgi:hypothetical protein
MAIRAPSSAIRLVGAVGDHLHRDGPPTGNHGSIFRRNRQRHPGAAAFEAALDIAVPRRHVYDAEIRGPLEAPDQIAAGRAAVGIHDDQGDVLHVGGGRISEDEQLDHGRDEDHREHARIAAQFLELLPDQEAQAAHQPRSLASRADARPRTMNA